MGRGRAKAKQTRVARKLKYTSPDTDFDSIQKELSHHSCIDQHLVYDNNLDVERYADDPNYQDYRDIKDDGEREDNT